MNLSNIASVASSQSFTYFLDTSGNVHNGQLGLGDTNNRETPVLNPHLKNIVHACAGLDHGLFLHQNGTVFSVGANGRGQLGSGNTIARTIPQPIPNLGNITQVGCGEIFSLYLTRNGTVLASGINSAGTLGVGFTIPSSILSPTILPILQNISRIGTTRSGSVALTKSGLLYTWGRAQIGETGQGFSSGVTLLPTLVPGMQNIVEFQAYRFTILAKHQNGTMFGVGQNVFGALGVGDRLARSTFTQIKGLEGKNIDKFCAGYGHSQFLTTDRKLYATGSNALGQTGLGDQVDDPIYSPIYVPISYQYPPENIWCSYSITFVLSRFGFFYFGVSEHSHYTPKTIFELKGSTTKISIGYDHSLYMNDKNQVFGTGSNIGGQLGFGNVLQQISQPTKIPIPDQIFDIHAGVQFSLFLTSKGEIWSSGSNFQGQLGLGNTTQNNQFTPKLLPLADRVSKIFTSSFGAHIFAKVSNGSIVGWGFNQAGQLCLGDMKNRFSPTIVSRLTSSMNISQIAIGAGHSIFLTSNGTVYVTGANDVGQLGLVGVNFTQCLQNTTDIGGEEYYYPCTPFLHLLNFTSPITLIAAGGSHSLFLDIHNRLWGTGDSSTGQLGESNSVMVPKTISLPPGNITKISCGDLQTLIILNGTLYSSGLNNLASLGLGFVSISVITPSITGTSRRVIDAQIGNSHGMLLTSCPDGKSGPNCEFGVCFGISSASVATVCSGQGTCVGFDKCECIAPSYGAECQFSQYQWKRVSGSWTNSDNWKIQRGNNLFETLSYPKSSGDSISFVEDGTFTITISDPSLQIGAITFGGPNARYHLEIAPGTQIEMLKSLQMTDSVTVSAIGAKIISRETSILRSQTNWTNCELVGNYTVNKGAQMNINGGSLTSCFLRNQGTLNIQSSFSPILLSVTPNQWNDAVIFQEAIMRFQGSFSGSRSLLINSGELIIASNSSTSLGATLENIKRVHISGQGNHSIPQVVQNRATAEINLITSNLRVPGGINITGGLVNLGGSIVTSHFEFSSSDGFLNLISKLSIVGNATFQERATLFLVVGKNNEETDQINVDGKVVIDSLIVLSTIPGYAPVIGDTIPFLTSSSPIASNSQNLYLMGSPYKNARYKQNGNKFDFEIVFSVGSVENKGYDCHYLGSQKVLEMNRLDAQSKLILSLTTPRRSQQIGFGFDIGGFINTSMLVISTPSTGQISQYQHSSISVPHFILTTASESKSIFLLGPEYATITLLVSSNLLDAQNFVYYAEISNGTTGAHYFEKYPFRVGKDKTIACTNFLQPSRAEVDQFPGLIVMQLIYLFIFILCIVFARSRPMNTRGISPGLTVFFLFAQLMLEIRNYFEVPVYQGSLCLYLSLGYYPLNQIVFVTIFLYFLRYFAIINLNQNKMNLYQTLQFGQKIQTWLVIQTRLLKILSSWIFAIFFIVVSYLVIVAIYLVILAGYSFVCTFETLIVIRVVNSLELIFIYMLTILSLVGDMLPNYKMILKCKWFQYVFGDPYWFRCQVLFFFPFMLYSLAIELFSLIGASTYLGVVTQHTAQTILNTISAQMLLILDVLFPLVLTIWYVMVNFCRKKIKASPLVDALKIPEVNEMFAKFAEQEFAIENYAIWSDLMHYKAAGLKEREQIAVSIFVKYLNGSSSPMEINISIKVCEEVKRNLFSPENRFEDNLFEEIEKGALANLSDTWFRFCVSSQYKQYCKDQQSSMEMIEGKTKL